MGDAEHATWVRDVMTELRTISAGMTRKELMKVFKQEGGISTPRSQTFICRRCQYFRVEVSFESATLGLTGEKLSQVWQQGWRNEFGENCSWNPGDVITQISPVQVGYPNRD